MSVRFVCIFLVGCSSLHKAADPDATIFESDQEGAHIIHVGDTSAASHLASSVRSPERSDRSLIP